MWDTYKQNDIWGLVYYQKQNKTGVIHDPLGQFHNFANNILLHLKDLCALLDI